MTDYVSVALDSSHHQLDEFDCGVISLNEWLIRHASKAKDAGTANTYVWTEMGSDRVVGYYAITPHLVRRADVPKKMDPGGSEIPSYLLAKLALNADLQGKGLGSQLLLDALERMVEAADIASGRLVVVDVADETIAKFYKRNGFKSVQANPYRLFQKISTIRADLGL